jgi:hypothetical protein
MTVMTRNGLHGLALTLALAACTATPDPTGPTMTPPPVEQTPTRTGALSPSRTPEPTAPAEETAVIITIGDTALHGQLWDNSAARDLATRLPLTLTFSDYNAVEKTARLEPGLPMDGMPAGDDPNPGEIGWYAPSSNLVLYYGDVGHWNGIARLGTFDRSGIELLAEGPHDTTVTIARADG